MQDCVFCKIRDGIIPSQKLYEDDEMFIIKDIYPKAKLHFLMIPKRHYKLLADMTAEDAAALARSLKRLPQLAEQLGLQNGFRLVINQGEDAVQTVFHLHVHILGGEKLPV